MVYAKKINERVGNLLGVLSAITLILSLVWFGQSHAAQIPLSVTILPAIATTETGAIDYYELALSPVSVMPNNPMMGVESVYDIAFTPQKPVPGYGKIILYFPGGFVFLQSCATPLPVYENKDLNGLAEGVVAMTSIACSTSVIAVTIGAVGIRAGDTVHFLVQGISNPPNTTQLETREYSVGIETQGVSGQMIELKTSLPFFLIPSGTQKISGTLFNDNGAGFFGFARDGVQGGSEPGIAGAHVCLGGGNGVQCTTTNTEGLYEFTKLKDGYYSLSVPPLTTGAVVGGPFFVDLALAGGQSRENLNFAFTPAEQTITVVVSAIPSGADMDVFAFGTGEDGEGGRVVREVIWNGQAVRTVSLPVSDGVWSVGVGPTFSKDFSRTGGTIVTSSFVLPQSQIVRVSGDNSYDATFVLRSAEKLIKGRVIDGGGSGLADAFVLARPGALTASGGKEVVTTTLNDGTFELRVAAGAYGIEASIPGMPPANEIDVLVGDDTGNAWRDNNATADVYSGGALITNDGDGGKDNLRITIAKGERSISGRVFDEDGNPVTYAHVSAEEIDEDGNLIGGLSERSTDATGSFTLFVYDGRWKVRASALSAGDIPSKIAVVSGTNLSEQNLSASMARMGTVRGSVVKDGKGVSGALVSAFGSSGGGMTTTDSGGAYSLRMKAGSGYVIDVNAKGAGRLPPIENVTVSAGVTLTEKNFVFESPGTVITSISGVTDAFVDVRDARFNGDGTSLNPTSGEYRISVPPGIYTVTAQNSTFGVLGEKKNISVQSGKSVTVSFTAPSSFAVSGSIVSDTPACAVGANVYAVDTTNGRVAEATTSTGGTYEFMLSNGTYTVTVSKPGCIDGGQPLAFTVANGGALLPNRTLTQAASELSGAIQLGGKNVSMETKITAQSTTGTVQSTSVITAHTTGNNYTLTLTPGVWKVSARADGYQSALHTITVAGSRTLNLTMAAIPGHVATERTTTPVVPSQGGIIKNGDAGTKFVVVLPAGALGNSADSGSVSTKVTTAVVTRTATAEVVGGKGIEITPKDAAGKPIATLASGGTDARITIPYAKSDVAALGIDETKLMLAVWSEDKQQWTPFPTIVDTGNATLSGVPPHFSVFAPIVAAATPSLPQIEQPPQEPVQQQTTSGTGSPSGIVLVPQPAQQAQTSTEKIVDVPEPIGRAEPLVVERAVTDDTLPHNQRPQQESVKPKIVKKRFPVRGVAAPIVLAKLSQPDVGSSSQKTELRALFEISIAVGEPSRVMIEGGDLVVGGEMIKSVKEQEEIPVRFTIYTKDGTIVARHADTLKARERISFSKIFHLEKTLLPGYYSVDLEATYRGDVITSTDRFQIQGRIPKVSDVVVLTSGDDGSEARFMSLFLVLFGMIVFGGILQLWYTVRKHIH